MLKVEELLEKNPLPENLRWTSDYFNEVEDELIENPRLFHATTFSALTGISLRGLTAFEERDGEVPKAIWATANPANAAWHIAYNGPYDSYEDNPILGPIRLAEERHRISTDDLTTEDRERAEMDLTVIERAFGKDPPIILEVDFDKYLEDKQPLFYPEFGKERKMQRKDIERIRSRVIETVRDKEVDDGFNLGYEGIPTEYLRVLYPNGKDVVRYELSEFVDMVIGGEVKIDDVDLSYANSNR
jgi:hypothetical protein